MPILSPVFSSVLPCRVTVANCFKTTKEIGQKEMESVASSISFRVMITLHGVIINIIITSGQKWDLQTQEHDMRIWQKRCQGTDKVQWIKRRRLCRVCVCNTVGGILGWQVNQTVRTREECVTVTPVCEVVVLCCGHVHSPVVAVWSQRCSRMVCDIKRPSQSCASATVWDSGSVLTLNSNHWPDTWFLLDA